MKRNLAARASQTKRVTVEAEHKSAASALGPRVVLISSVKAAIVRKTLERRMRVNGLWCMRGKKRQSVMVMLSRFAAYTHQASFLRVDHRPKMMSRATCIPHHASATL